MPRCRTIVLVSTNGWSANTTASVKLTPAVAVPANGGGMLSADESRHAAECTLGGGLGSHAVPLMNSMGSAKHHDIVSC